MLTPEEVTQLRTDAGFSPTPPTQAGLPNSNQPTGDIMQELNNSAKVYDAKYNPTPATTKEKPQGLSKVVGGIAGGAKDLAIGVEKGITSSLTGLAEIGTKATSFIPGQKDLANQTLQAEEDFKNKQLSGENITQNIGKGAEQVGELLIPVGLEEKVAQALGKIPEIAKDAPLISKIVQSVLKMGAKAGASGAEFAGKTYLQSGGNTKQALEAGATATVASPVIAGAGKLLEKVPETAWGNILKRTPSSVEKNPNLEKQIAKEGVVGLTKPQISATFGRQIQDLEMQISDKLQGQTGKISTQDVVSRLDELKSKYANIPGEEKSVEKINQISQETLAKGKEMSVQDANQLKRDIYGLISKSYGKGLLEVPAKSEAQKMVALGLKEEIEKQVPGIKELNNQQGVYLQAKKAIDKAIARQTGKGIAGTGVGLFDILAGLGGGLKDGVLGAAGAVAGKKILESPGVSSLTSKVTKNLLDYFTTLSPTQRMLFYNGLKGLSSKAVTRLTNQPN